MAPKNPIGRLADTAINSLKHPRDTAEKVVEQARGTAALGKMVAEQVGKSAVSRATGTAGAVARASGRKPSSGADGATESATLRSVPDVNEPGHTPAENEAPGPVKRSDSSSGKRHGDPVKEAADQTAKKTTGTKAAGTKATSRKTTAAKSAAKEAPAKKKAASRQAASKKSAAATPADVAEVIESKSSGGSAQKAASKKTPAKKTPAKKTPGKKASAEKTSAKKTPAKKAPAKATAKKAPAAQAVPGDKLPAKKTAEQAAKKSPAKKSPAKKAAPKTAAQLAADQGDDVTTPVGTPAAGQADNPDTGEQDLNQPGTEGIVEGSTAKAVAKETERLRKAAENNPE